MFKELLILIQNFLNLEYLVYFKQFSLILEFLNFFDLSFLTEDQIFLEIYFNINYYCILLYLAKFVKLNEKFISLYYQIKKLVFINLNLNYLSQIFNLN